MKQRQAVTKNKILAYKHADRAGKTRMLDELVDLTGWHRDYARQALRNALTPTVVKPKLDRPEFSGEGLVQRAFQLSLVRPRSLFSCGVEPRGCSTPTASCEPIRRYEYTLPRATFHVDGNLSPTLRVSSCVAAMMAGVSVGYWRSLSSPLPVETAAQTAVVLPE